MHCSYCFYSDVAASRNQAFMGIMSHEIADLLIINSLCVLEAGDHITFAFQGGEPSLAGLDFFLHFTKKVKESTPKGVKVHYAMQSNGLLLNDDWCVFFRKNNFLIGLSLDGDAALHNQNRMDNYGKGTFNRVMDAKKMLNRHDVTYNILCVLTAESARRAKRLWNFIVREQISYIQFIPCLEPLEENPRKTDDKTALSGERFYRFYSDLYPLWKKELEKGNLIYIRLFEELAATLLGGQRPPCSLSGICSPQIIVEADGSVYPCDFYVLDEHKVSNLTTHNLKDAFEAVAASDFLNKPQELSPLKKHCANCQHNIWCKGGCKRMSQTVYGKGCGMRMFLDECLQDLLETFANSL